ncbi:type VI secretion system baseplate subunit TssK [Cloacibacillus porcorum]|uniref:type VI secretion system baseplate subunit TssK n=1 Tax=Cloacibacillus porcorum TaxID=1197717 RepID=UPI0026735CF6|nr:type VI secretion system baseplate subunit TssK [Cloacibacillus porcorum]
MNNNPVFWEHGVFLQPQHFQLEYIQNIRRAAAAMALLNPYLWGVRRLEVNENAVSNGIFEIVSMELLLPSGEWVSFPGNAWLPPRTFGRAWTNPEAPLTVYAGIAEFRESGGNVVRASSPEEAPENFRYAAPSEPDSVPDYYCGEPDMDVSTLRYNMRLCFGEEEGGALWKIPLARLMRDGERVRIDERMAPPCVDIAAVPALYRIVHDVSDTLLSRNRHLDDYKIVGSDGNWQGIQSHGAVLVAILGLLGRSIPDLDRWLSAPNAHPWEVYGSLCRLAGELSVFAQDLSPLGETRQGGRIIPPYNHMDLYGCFRAVSRVIMRLVDTLVMGPQFIFDLEQAGTPGIYSAVMPQNALSAGSFDYWLLLRSSDVKELTAVGALSKLAPTSEMSDVVTQALPGIRMRRSEQPPLGLPRRGDTLYFRIDSNDPLWRRLEQDGEISYMLPGAPEDLRVQVTVVER